ncbi:MAG: hypothetical protein ACFE9D_11295 [Promethearchaeota archaeon]
MTNNYPSTTKPIQIQIWYPTISTIPITNKAHLHTLIITEYPHLTIHPNYPKLLTDAERHLDIIDQLKDESNLYHGDISHLARILGVNRTIIYRHVRQALKPRLYWYIDNAISKTQASHQLTEIHTTNTHIQSLTDLQNRLNTYYPSQFLEPACGQKDRLTQCQKYFLILLLLAEGGHSYTDLSTHVGKTVTNIKDWCTNHTRPGLLNLARHIPSTPPEHGNQWLPLTMEGRFHPTHFIQVPTSITDWSQITLVLQQLTPLTNEHMSDWHHHFGPIPQDEAFAYLLGNLVSDAGKITPHYTSTRLELNLSKNYTWSQQVGEAVCYYLGRLGIFAEYKTSSSRHRWRSQNSPLLTWIKHVCLGLTPQQLTTYTPINAPWLLTAPNHIRTKFLQGLNDGDGHVLVGYQQLGNASEKNSGFLTKLLSTFKIRSWINIRRVIIEQIRSIFTAVELPFFLHAIERQEKANKLAKMIRSRIQHSKVPVSYQVSSYIWKLHEKGFSYGEIAEIIFDKFQICYHPKRVSKVIRRYKR